MDIVSGYAAGIEKAGRKLFGETERIYSDAVPFLISVYDAEWSVLSQISGKE